MIIPVGDSPNARITPVVTYALIAVNVLIFLLSLPLMGQVADPNSPLLHEYLDALIAQGRLAPDAAAAAMSQVSSYDLMVFSRGLRPSSLSLLDFMTAMFLHGGWMHLLGNMLFLWIFADNLEARLGRGGFLAFYLITGIAAGVGDVVLRWGSPIPSVGASGAISGVLGGYFIWFPRNRVRLFVLFFPFIMRTINVGARWVLGFYLIVQNIFPWLLTGSEAGVSYGAHIGGFFAGAAAAMLLGGRLQIRAPGRSEHESLHAEDNMSIEESRPVAEFQPKQPERSPRWESMATDSDGGDALRVFMALSDAEVSSMPLSRIEATGRQLTHAARLQDAAVLYERTLRVRGTGADLNNLRLAFALVLRRMGGFEPQSRALAQQVLAAPRSEEESKIAHAFVFRN